MSLLLFSGQILQHKSYLFICMMYTLICWRNIHQTLIVCHVTHGLRKELWRHSLLLERSLSVRGDMLRLTEGCSKAVRKWVLDPGPFRSLLRRLAFLLILLSAFLTSWLYHPNTLSLFVSSILKINSKPLLTHHVSPGLPCFFFFFFFGCTAQLVGA